MSRVAAVVLAVTLLGAGAQARPARFHRMGRSSVARVLGAIHDRHASFRDRLLAISAMFLGTPYRFSPLGEGKTGLYDRDPLFQLRQVDCLTLVEQVIALAHSADLDEAQFLLQRIRYRSGRIAYRARHHFTMSQWIPANQRLGVLRDVTAQIGGTAVTEVRQRIPRSIWRGRWRRWRERLGANTPQGEFRLPVIPLRDAIRLSERFPPGSLVSVVRVPDLRNPDPISHQGLVVVKGGRRYLRHASSGIRFRRVLDYPLRAYLRFSSRYFRRRARPVLGVNVQQITRSRRLMAHLDAEPPARGPGSLVGRGSVRSVR